MHLLLLLLQWWWVCDVASRLCVATLNVLLLVLGLLLLQLHWRPTSVHDDDLRLTVLRQ